MSRVTEEEARALLSDTMRCIDIGDWLPARQQSNTWVCGSGVVDLEGVRSTLSVELLFRRSPKTGMIWYKFSVFFADMHGVPRVRYFPPVFRRF